jgi:hypothetical protein
LALEHAFSVQLVVVQDVEEHITNGLCKQAQAQGIVERSARIRTIAGLVSDAMRHAHQVSEQTSQTSRLCDGMLSL